MSENADYVDLQDNPSECKHFTNDHTSKALDFIDNHPRWKFCFI